ncbi:HotDog domain-containing protein [Dunaliella salina]|uniref:HotDog domain-containing protein n=1 Tax=Dunaliella salina TaxID=3046 RepID=A0ABQ7GEN2_DUNSA|nr:HotDog domain-containing protein [Dunaliella salina]|eukprot:KAF5833060.1 HotDog domain-containing protein [Dunaliella salina]
MALTAPCRGVSSQANRGACVHPPTPALISRPIAARSLLTPRSASESKRTVFTLAATEDAPAAEHKVGVEKTGPNFSAIRDINAIMQTLPHRYPFLLVDRVVEWEKEKYAVGYKCVTINDNFFTGHFPERPIMPGAHALMMRAEITKYNKRFGVVKALGKGYVGDELVVEAELTIAMGK